MVVVKNYIDFPCETSLVEEDGNLLLQYRIEDHFYRFNVDWVEEGHGFTKQGQLDWLAGVCSKIITRVYSDGRKDFRDEIKGSLKTLKDLLE